MIFGESHVCILFGDYSDIISTGCLSHHHQFSGLGAKDGNASHGTFFLGSLAVGFTVSATESSVPLLTGRGLNYFQ